MYHFYAYNQERFMENYHKRSNVESTFMMIKAKFGDALRSKTERRRSMRRCARCCATTSVASSKMYELNLRPKFWAQVA